MHRGHFSTIEQQNWRKERPCENQSVTEEQIKIQKPRQPVITTAGATEQKRKATVIR